MPLLLCQTTHTVLKINEHIARKVSAEDHCTGQFLKIKDIGLEESMLAGNHLKPTFLFPSLLKINRLLF